MAFLAFFLTGVSLGQAATAFYATVYDAVEGEGKVVAIDKFGNSIDYATGFDQPEGLAQDRQGNVFVIDGEALWKIAAPGVREIVATKPNAYNSWGMAMDAFDNIYVTGNSDLPSFAPQIYKFFAATSYGTYDTWTAAGTATGLAIGNDGALYAADGNIVRYDINTGAYETYYEFSDAYAGFQVFGLAFNAQGELFVSGYLDTDQVLKISADLSSISTVVDAGLTDVRGITLDGAGNLFMANWACGCGPENAIMSQSGMTAVLFSGQGDFSPNFIIAASPVPEPSALWLLAAGLGIIALRKSRRRSR